jgi:hypothetical protein
MKLISQSKPYPAARYIQDAPIYHLDDTLAHSVVKTMIATCFYRYEHRLIKLNGWVDGFDAVSKYSGVRVIKQVVKRKTGTRAYWSVVSIAPIVNNKTDQATLGLVQYVFKKGVLTHAPVVVFNDHALARLLQRHVGRASEEALLDAVAIVGADLYDHLVKSLPTLHLLEGDFKVDTRLGTLCCSRTDGLVTVKTFFKD